MICKSSNVFLWGSWCFYDVRLKYRHLRDVDDDVARRVNDQEQMIEMSQVMRPIGPDLDCAIYEHLGKIFTYLAFKHFWNVIFSHQFFSYRILRDMINDGKYPH